MVSAPDPLPPDAGVTLARVRRDVSTAVDRAERWQRQSLAELEWSDVERLSDAVRADANGRLDRTVSDAIARVGREGVTDGALRARAARLMKEAGWPDEALGTLAVRHARRAWLAERLMAAARPFGAVDPLDALVSAHGDLVSALRSGASSATALELTAQDRHDLDWSVAAALRVALSEAGRTTGGDDEHLRHAVAISLAGHDEGARVDAVAERLARRLSPSDLTAVDALLAGYVALFAAVVGDRADVAATMVETWLVAPDPLPVGLAMRAAGETVAEIGGALVTVANVLSRPLASALLTIDRLHGLSGEEAARLLEAAR